MLALDTVYVDFRNEAGLRRECEEARRDGFQGKMAIHPAQVATINDVFTPKPEAIAKAKAIIAALPAEPGAGVVGIGGVMYDRPHLTKALRLLARAQAAGMGDGEVATWRKVNPSPGWSAAESGRPAPIRVPCYWIARSSLAMAA